MKRGVTLFELLVCMFLIGLLGTMATVSVVRGLQWFQDSNTAQDIRQEALLGLSTMMRELKEASVATIQVETAPNDAAILPSVRNTAGQVVLTFDGKMVWQSVLCFSVEPRGNDKWLMRRQNLLPPTTPPRVRAPDPYALAPVRNIAFMTSIDPFGRRMCRYVDRCEFKKKTDSIEVTLTCKLSERTDHSIELTTQVVPRQR